MTSQSTEVAWTDAGGTVTVAELTRITTLTEGELVELIDYGALAPLGQGQTQLLFASAWVTPLRAAGKLRRDFDLDIFAVAILLEYLLRIDGLELEVRAMRARMPQMLASLPQDR
jgi:chaperone modulatory protein CbpM